MRILEVVKDFGIGGVQRGASNFARGLHRLGHEVQMVVVDDSGPRRSEIVESGIDCLSPGDDGAIDKHRLLRADIVHIHSHGLPAILVQDLRAALKTSCFIEQSIWSRPYAYTPMMDAIVHQSAWMAWTYACRTWARRSGPPSHLLDKPLDIERFSNLGHVSSDEWKELHGVPEGRKLIGRVGQPNEGKWHPEIVRIAHELLEGGEDIGLVLIGPSKEVQESLQAAPGRVRRRSIVMDASLNDQELGSIYRSLDVFVHSARLGETFGQVIVESMGNGTPVVGRSTPTVGNAQVELIRRSDSGLAARTKAGMIEAVSRILNDAEFSNLLGSRGAKFASEFRSEKVCQDLLEIGRVPSSSSPLLKEGLFSQTEEAISIASSVIEGRRELESLLLRLRPAVGWNGYATELWRRGFRMATGERL